jgi:hypothetical protein
LQELSADQPLQLLRESYQLIWFADS